MKTLAIISAVMLFGFWFFCIFKYGFKDCLSRYSTHRPWWSIALIGSAALLIPVMLELTEGKMMQFAGFLAPVSLFIVGVTNEWQKDDFQYWLHNIGVILAVLFSVVYTLMFHGFVWYILVGCLFAGVCGLIDKKRWLHYAEFAVYGAMYTEIFTLLF